jgi:hypothetical protein
MNVPADLTFVSTPRISRAMFMRVLATAHSPAAAVAGDLYDLIASFGLDPAIALAFFMHESDCGTRGIAVKTRNPGNLRASVGRAYQVAQGFAWYRSWLDGMADWCQLILIYVRQGAGHQRGTPLPTVRLALVEYAPSDDHNDPAGYAGTVLRLVAEWMGSDPDLTPQADPWAAWGTRHPLTEGQHGWGIPQAWLATGSLGAAIAPEIYADGGVMSVQFFAHGAIIYWADTKSTTVARHP